MKKGRSLFSTHAFTLPEVLVMLVILGILGSVAIPYLTQAKNKALRIRCVGRLKNIGLSFRIYAADNQGLYPMAKFTNWIFSATNVVRYYQELSNELSTPIILSCPADRLRKPARNFQNISAQNVSYFVGFDATENDPQSFLAGDRNLQGEPIINGVLTLTTNSTNLAWRGEIHKNQGDVALGDGSVQQLSSMRLRQAVLAQSITNRLLMPE